MSTSPYVVDVTIENFQQKVLEGSQDAVVVLDIWADWCEPCKQLMPILEKLANEYQGNFILARVNAEEQQQLAAHLQVRSLPNVKIVKDGQLVDEFNGALPEKEIRQILDKHVEAPQESDQDKAERLFQEGDLEGALEVYRKLNQENPEDYEVLLRIGLIQAELDQLDSARQILDSLPPEERTRPDAKQLAARLKFADDGGELPPRETLQQKLAEKPDDCEAMNLLAQHEILAGNNEAAMEWLIQSLQTDKTHNDGAAKQTLIELFDMLGNQDPLVRQYRRKLFTLMY